MTTDAIIRFWPAKDIGSLDIPISVRRGDFVFTSTVYAVDAYRGLGNDGPSRSGNYESPISRQARIVFDRLEEALEVAGSALLRVVRCDVELADEHDFYEFNLVWKQRFGETPPARLAFGVGKDLMPEGALIGLHAVGLAKDAQVTREIIVAPDALNSLQAESAAQAIRAGDYVFATALPAYANYTSGLIDIEDRLLSVAERQAISVMENLEKVFKTAGTSLVNTVKAQNFMVDRADWKHINPVWGRFMGPVPSPRSSITVRNIIASGGRAMCSAIAVRPSASNSKEASRSGFDVSKIGYNFSPAVQTRDWISLAGALAYDYATFSNLPEPSRLSHLFSAIELQVDAIMADRFAILEQNGAGAKDVLEAKVFLKEPRQNYSGLIRSWRRWFPDADCSPALQVIPVDDLNYDGTVVEIELLAARPYSP